jgi:hypothetical protein
MMTLEPKHVTPQKQEATVNCVYYKLYNVYPLPNISRPRHVLLHMEK